MSLNSLLVFFADAGAAGATQDPLNPTGQLIRNLTPMILIGVVFYLFMIRPQQKKQKEHMNLISGIKPGDKIVTTGGIIGVVLTVKEKSVTIRSTDTKLEITKSAIGDVT